MSFTTVGKSRNPCDLLISDLPNFWKMYLAEEHGQSIRSFAYKSQLFLFFFVSIPLSLLLCGFIIIAKRFFPNFGREVKEWWHGMVRAFRNTLEEKHRASISHRPDPTRTFNYVTSSSKEAVQKLFFPKKERCAYNALQTKG